MAEEQRYGRDELNLVDLAFATLSASGTRKTLEVEWNGTDEAGNQKRFFKIVSGTDKFGLPDYSAEELLLALLFVSSQGDFNTPIIETTPSELLDLMEWGTDGRYYQRLKKALNQLTGVKIYTNALWDAERASFVETGFGIVDRYRFEKSLNDRRQTRLVIKWSDDVFEQFQKRQFKRLDLSFFYSLRSAVSKRLYRWLDKHFEENGHVEEDLRTLAHAKLLISRSRNTVSGIMQILQPALDEFNERRFCRYHLADGSRPGEKRIVFERWERPARLEEGPGAEIVDQLCKRGIAAAAAEALVEQFPLDQVLRQIEHYDYLCRVGRTPETAGWLVKAIRNDYKLPAKLVEQQDRRKRQEHQQSQLELELNAATTAKADRLARFQKRLDALSQEQRAELERKAVEMLDEFGRMLYDRGPDRPAVRGLILDNMERLLLGEVKVA